MRQLGLNAAISWAERIAQAEAIFREVFILADNSIYNVGKRHILLLKAASQAE